MSTTGKGRAHAFGNYLPAGPHDTRSLAREGSAPDHRRGTQLHIALLGRPGSPSLDVRGVVRAEKIEHAHHPADRSAPPTLVTVLRKGAIRSHAKWDFQMRLPCRKGKCCYWFRLRRERHASRSFVR
jgi:hypothetical protein